MVNNSKRSKALMHAYNKGYRVLKDGAVISHLKNYLKLIKSSNGYYSFSIKFNSERYSVSVHQLQAYQKFGDAIFDLDYKVQIRHLNGISTDNSWNNIDIGTPLDNHLDKPKAVRDRFVRAGANALKNFTNDQVREIRKLREEGMIYRKIGEIYNISKGHTCDICNKKIYKDVI